MSDLPWRTMLVPSGSLLEVFLRGTVMYFFLLGTLRVLVRRHVGPLGLNDLLLMVLIADAAQNAMADDYRSVTEGVVLCGTLIGWSCLCDWLSFRYPAVARLLEPSPLPIVRNGKLLRRNMRQELVTEDELRSQLREHGVEDVGDVRIACIEPDGKLSIFLHEGAAPRAPDDKRSPGVA